LLVSLLIMHFGQMTAYRGSLLSIALLASALVAWGMSASARRTNIDWLRTADVLVAQGLVLASLAAWRTNFGEPLVFYGVIFVETILFLRLVIRDHGGGATIAGAYVALAATVIFIVAGAWTVGEITSPGGAWQLAGAMFAAVCVLIGASAYLDRQFRERLNELVGADALLVTGFLAGLMVVVAMMALKDEQLLGLVTLAAGAGLILGANRLRPLGLVWSAWIVLAAMHLFVWLLCFTNYAGASRPQFFLLAPTAALALLAIWKTPEHRAREDFRRAAIYLLGINLGISAYLLLSPPSALLPTVTWLVMSVVALEFAGRARHTPAALATLHIGLLYIAAAALGYTTVVLPTYSYIGNFNVRLAIEIFGMATLVYWWIVQPREPLASLAQWRNTQPYFLELALVLLVTTVFVEVSLIWRASAWMTIALLFLMPPFGRLASRFAFYSLAAFVTSVLALTVNVSTVSVPSPNWIDQPWNVGLIAVVLQVTYLFLAYQRLELETATFPNGLYKLAQFSRYLSRDRAATICYPFFAGLALFLAWRFEQALLTFLWAFEVFVIFVLSIVFRENHFRLVALTGMAACLLRLVTYDLREADLFIRGLVFIGVGVLMLAMNAVYNKFGARVNSK